MSAARAMGQGPHAGLILSNAVASVTISPDDNEAGYIVSGDTSSGQDQYVGTLREALALAWRGLALYAKGSPTIGPQS